MPFSVYIAKPPMGGGYDPKIYKIGMTTQDDVRDRVAGLNAPGSNYPTGNGEDWELYQRFEFEDAEQMKAFESAMMKHLDTGVDPLGQGATELFRSSDIDADIEQAAIHSFRDMVEAGYVDPTEVLNAEYASGMLADSVDLGSELLEVAPEEFAQLILKLLLAGGSVGGIFIAVWRGKRLFDWIRTQYRLSQKAARKRKIQRTKEPSSVTQARAAFQAMSRRSQPNR